MGKAKILFEVGFELMPPLLANDFNTKATNVLRFSLSIMSNSYGRTLMRSILSSSFNEDSLLYYN